MRKFLTLLMAGIILVSCRVPGILLTVSSQRTNCVATSPRKCFLVKEDKSGDWEYLHGTIDNFNWTPGYEYQLLVHKRPIQNAPENAPSFVYVMDEVVGKKYVGYDLDIAGTYIVTHLNNYRVEPENNGPPSTLPHIRIDSDGSKITGSVGCNSFIGKFHIVLNVLKCNPICFQKNGNNKTDYEKALYKIMKQPATLEKIDDELLVWQNNKVVMMLRYTDD